MFAFLSVKHLRRDRHHLLGGDVVIHKKDMIQSGSLRRSVQYYRGFGPICRFFWRDHLSLNLPIMKCTVQTFYILWHAALRILMFLVQVFICWKGTLFCTWLNRQYHNFFDYVDIISLIMLMSHWHLLQNNKIHEIFVHTLYLLWAIKSFPIVIEIYSMST